MRDRSSDREGEEDSGMEVSRREIIEGQNYIEKKEDKRAGKEEGKEQEGGERTGERKRT